VVHLPLPSNLQNTILVQIINFLDWPNNLKYSLNLHP
jgi:hypothetical protein